MKSSVILALVSLLACLAADAQTVRFLDSFGTGGTGNGQFNQPTYVAVNSATGQVYVADQFNNRVQRFDSAGNYQAQVSLIPYIPLGIAVRNTTGQVFVTNHTNPTSFQITRYNADLGFQASISDSGITTASGTFSLLYGIAVNEATGQIYFADRDNNHILRYSADFIYLGQWGSTGTGNGQFMQPGAIAIDQSTGQVYVTDRFNHRVQRFDAGGIFQKAWGANGTGDGQFNLPLGIAVDKKHRVYVSEANGNRVQRFSPDGAFQLKFGSTGTGPDQFMTAFGLAVVDSGILYVVDSVNNRVKRYQVVDPPSRPTIALKGKARQTTTKSRIVLKGTADDEEAVARVDFKVGSKPFKRATGTTRWKFAARLEPGKNKILIRAVNGDGLKSKPERVLVARK